MPLLVIYLLQVLKPVGVNFAHGLSSTHLYSWHLYFPEQCLKLPSLTPFISVSFRSKFYWAAKKSQINTLMALKCFKIWL